MRNPLKLVIEMCNQPLWVMAWISVLVVVNMLSLAYWGQPLARWVAGIFLLQGAIMMALYSVYGYEKILGLAHIFWLPLLAYIVFNIGSYTGNFQYYLIALLCINSLSVVFDILDVIDYFKNKTV